MGSKIDMRTESSLDTYETPQWLVAEVKDFFGGSIDLDPCTSPSNPVGALEFETAESNGLSSTWQFNSNAYVNSPYGRALRFWVDKCVHESANSDLEIVQLMPARFGSGWFKDMAKGAAAFGVFNKRLLFTLDGKPVVDKQGRPTTAQFDAVLALYANDQKRVRAFKKHFAKHLTFWKLD